MAKHFKGRKTEADTQPDTRGIAVAAVLPLLFLACADPEPRARTIESANRHVAILGDSTAVPWPPVLQELRPDLLVTHYAEGGATTYDIADQWLLHVRPMGNVDAVVILGGINDAANLWSMEVSFSRLAAIYEDAQSLDVDVYAITVIPGAGSYLAYVEDMNRRIRESSATVIDLVDQFTGHSELYMDTVHPNAMGQRLIAEAVAEAVR